jgi:hypothetical protein
MLRGTAAVAALAALLGTAGAPKPVAFGPARGVLAMDVSDLGSIRIEAAADFNGDGAADVAVVRGHWPTFDTYPMRILLSNRRGGFVDGTTGIFEGAPPRVQFPRELVVSDFNGDGRADVFVADTGYDASPGPGYQNSLVLSTPTGKLRDASANLPQQSDFTHSAAAGDVNGDGAVDLYVGNMYGEIQKHGPAVLLNDGSGRFTQCSDCLPADVVNAFGTTPIWASSALVDVDGADGLDLVLGANGIPGIGTPPNVLLLNDGTGHYRLCRGALPPSLFGGVGQGYDIQPIELDGDRHPDLVIATTQTVPYGVGRQLQLLVNNGNGTFRDETSARIAQVDSSLPSSFIKYVHVVDLNGDSAPDLIGQLVEGGREAPPVWLNSGKGVFTPLRAGYGNTVANVFVEVDAKANGHRDFFTTDTYGFPSTSSFVVAQAGKPVRPGRPAPPVVSRSGGDAILWWPYDWGAARYEVWSAPSVVAQRRLVGRTALTRYVARGAAGSVFWLRAANSAGKSAYGDPAR